MTESNCHYLITRQVFYHLTNRAYLEQREGFEPPVLRICNPLHWAALPPLHKLGTPNGNRTRVTDLKGQRSNH